MQNYKLFVSHSSKDEEVANAFVNFMYKIGLSNEQIICSSTPGTHIPAGEEIYNYLGNQIYNEKIYAIFLLSDNYYVSSDCLNEMGAIWLKKAESLCLLMPGFDFKDMEGVVKNTKIGIKLGSCDSMTKSLFNDYKVELERKFGLNVNLTRWEVARDEFLGVALNNARVFDMAFSRSFCIGDDDNDGCAVIKKESNSRQITAKIDFNETVSNLCSIIVYVTTNDFRHHFINGRSLCFEAYADSGVSRGQVELRISNVDMPVTFLLDTDENTYRISLEQFCNSVTPWKNLSEIKFVFQRKRVGVPGKVVIKNLRLE
ncbi:MAG: hypothetical protein Q4C48_06780 [Lachnospiraceae bacterium]|nr:hypothetical protein [Lachnospiraceae bacterium]